MNKIYLNVPFTAKEHARAAGAQWNAQAKLWYWVQPESHNETLPAALDNFAPFSGAISEFEFVRLAIDLRAVGKIEAADIAKALENISVPDSMRVHHASQYQTGLSFNGWVVASVRGTLESLRLQKANHPNRFPYELTREQCRTLMMGLCEAEETDQSREFNYKKLGR